MKEYLINVCLGSAMKYTIIHPGGLLDKKGGVNQIVMGFDDNVSPVTLCYAMQCIFLYTVFCMYFHMYVFMYGVHLYLH
jgi:hypothetical protein